MLVDTHKAAALLAQEDVVAIPTETVYGLAARYDSERAIRRVFELKNRPLDHPLIVHIGAVEWLNKLTDDNPSYVIKLIEAFWPGPLTLVLAKKKEVSPLITAGQSTIAVRMPRHPVCLELLSLLKMPVVAPSANPYCRISPTEIQHVIKYFSNTLPVLDGGSCELGIESTIVLATDEDNIQILRPGLISQARLEEISGVKCTMPNNTIKISGNKKKHYSPSMPLIPFSHAIEIEKYVNDVQHTYLFILINKFNTLAHPTKYIQNNSRHYASSLYALWHEAEDKCYDAIFIETPNSGDDYWQGIVDRINKASI